MDFITAICNMIQSGFNFFTKRTETQMPREIIQDKKTKAKACNYAEDLIALVDKYSKDNWSARDIRKYERLKRKFNKAD